MGERCSSGFGRESPAAYLKVYAMLVPKEMKVEHSQSLKNMTDEELDAAIAAVREMLSQRAAAGGAVIEGTAETVALPPQPSLSSRSASRTGCDGGQHRSRAAGAQAEEAQGESPAST
jgi:hypothetical protein